ncbi:phosphatase domain-containing protein [Qipengyuania qiaonensis]|uniref:App1 family protein n=1 Tax=Qipengyuania qiaonensis TaxID=2867240 RepID=A0ABS7J4A9_9SPHN|nr:App1 family protein [Qipengyuania qiaonensis]MBX7482168.1 App1 family protein [Qipengyuania qiaonensis]
MPFLPSAPVRIQPYFGYRNRDRLRITARALRSRVGKFEKRGKWRAAKTMLTQFASHEVPELSVELEIARPGQKSHRHQGLTDEEGFVHFDIRLDPRWDYGDQSAWETVVFHWKAGEEERCVDAHVLAPGRDTSLAVISDIDDTIVETGITGDFRAVLRNWRRVLVEMPEERILVPGADVFYNALGGSEVLADSRGQVGNTQSATHRPFFYVSSSPWNLFSYLVTYIRGRGLPLGPIFLRDWGLNRRTFGSSSHGAHKSAAIGGIIETYPEMKFALIGDDSQGDLTAFADIALTHPGRIRAVFIRKVGDAMSAEELTAKAKLEGAKVPLWLGDSYRTCRQFLASTGMLADDEVRAIVDTVEATAPETV